MDEIRRLAIIVDEFERPFHPDQVMLNVYKKVSHIKQLGKKIEQI